jgi:hypothetical protein
VKERLRRSGWLDCKSEISFIPVLCQTGVRALIISLAPDDQKRKR